MPEARRPDGPIGPSDFGVEQFTVPAVLDRRAEEFPDRLLMSIAGTPVTFAQMRDRSRAAANALVDIGVGRGDTVALFTATCPEWVYIWLGAARIGAVTAAVNVANKDDFLVHALRLSRAKVVITDAERHPRLLEVIDRVQTVKSVLVVGDSLTGRWNARRRLHRTPRRANPGTWRRCSSRRVPPARRKRSPPPGTTCSPRLQRRPPLGNSTRATCCGPPCPCSTSAPRHRYWRRCSSVRRRCCRRHFGRAKLPTRCEPAAQRVSPEPAPWSR